MTDGPRAEVLVRLFLIAHCDPDVLDPANVVVGKLTLEQIEAGGVAMREGGTPRISTVPGMVWARTVAEVRAPEASGRVDEIKWHVRNVLHDQFRKEIELGDGSRWLVQSFRVPTSASNIMFVETLAATEALAPAGG